MSSGVDPIEAIAGEILLLPNDRFLKAISLLERVKGHPSTQRALDAARSRLIELRPPRRMDLRRLFYLPMEDLLTNSAVQAAEEGRIGRDLMAICWRLIQDNADKAEFQRLNVQASEIFSTEWEKLKKAGERIWVLAATSLGEAAARAKEDSAYASQNLGSPESVAIVGDLSEAYKIAGEAVGLKERFPENPVVTFDDEDYSALIGAMKRIREGRTGDPWQLVWVMSARMANPIDFLMQFLKQRSFEPTPAVGPMVDRSVNQLEAEVGRTRERASTSGSASDVASQAVHMAATLASAKQLAKSRKHLAEQVDRIAVELQEMVREVVVEGAMESVMATLPGLNADELGTQPDLSDMAKAEDRVLALCQVSDVDPAMNLGPVVQQKLKAIATEVEKQIRSALDQLGSQPATPEGRRAAEAHLSHSTRLVELSEGPAAAERVMMDGHKRINAAFGKK